MQENIVTRLELLEAQHDIMHRQIRKQAAMIAALALMVRGSTLHTMSGDVLVADLLDDEDRSRANIDHAMTTLTLLGALPDALLEETGNGRFKAENKPLAPRSRQWFDDAMRVLKAARIDVPGPESYADDGVEETMVAKYADKVR